MKKLLIIVFIASCFGCSKKLDPTPQQTSWIIGKWKANVRYDLVDGVTPKYDTLAISSELTFDANFAHETGSNVGYSYKLGNVSTINIYNGDCAILKQSDTKFLLKSQSTSPDGLVIHNYTDVYLKE